MVLKNVKISGLPPPMEGVKIHETEEEKKIDPMEKKRRWINDIKEKQKEKEVDKNSSSGQRVEKS